MTGSSATATGGRPPRKRHFPFGLVMLAFGLGLGFYGGVAATKRALSGPAWVQQVFGLSAYSRPTPPPAAPVAPPVVAAAPAPNPPTPPTTAQPPAATGDAPGTDASSTETAPPPTGHVKRAPADSRDIVGAWTVTDSVPSGKEATSTMTSSYVFRADNSGEYDANGKKLYDFHWSPAGDSISLDFDGVGPDPNQSWNVKLNWSLNDDHDVLTLVPIGGKDPRSFVYSLGPGVYHKAR
jgi:hypothetical protein